MNRELVSELINNFDLFAATVNTDTKVDCTGVDALVITTTFTLAARDLFDNFNFSFHN